MELKQLRVLQAVGETGSFSAAADRLDYTQPAVSKIVATLERQLGTTLVDRGTRPLRLTEAGSALTQRAAAAFEQIAAAELEVEAIANLSAGSLRVGRSRAQAPRWSSTRYASSARATPTSTSRSRRSECPQHSPGRSDAATSTSASRSTTRRSATRSATTSTSMHLLDDPFDVVVPRGHRLERNRTIRFADLGGENWLLGDFGADSPSFRMIDRRCRDAGLDPHVAYRINDCQMTQALVAAGEGIALLPRLMLRVAHPGVAIRPLATDPPSRRVSAVRLSTRYLTPATERFLALLVAASADHGAIYRNES